VRPGDLRPRRPRRAAPGTPALSAPEPLLAFERTRSALGERYRLERIVASNADRVLFEAYDAMLKRRVSIRINFYRTEAIRGWFMREAEALGQLDHPAIRHIFDAGVVGELAYRIGTWIEGEGLEEAVHRGPRIIPLVLSLARDLLGALEHAHLRAIVVRRIVPATVLVGTTGRGTITDLRFSSYVLPAIPAGVVPDLPMYMAPEVRQGAPGDPASDVYTAGALLYFAVTGQAPPLDSRELRRPTELRPTCPRAVERLILRALRPAPGDRYLTAAEALEDLASEAGTFETRAVGVVQGPLDGMEDRARWEQWLRRALGDDYELLALLGSGGFGRVYRARDLHLERVVALKVLHPALTRDPEVVERFRREAQLAARLHHPNIVDIYDIAGRSGLIW
jgi:serine/threonine protein kinase